MTEPGGRARPRYQVTFALLALAGVAYALLQSLVAPALPDIQHSLHTTVNGVSWVLTAYLLSASIATPVIGRLGDMYGKERLLVAVLVLLCVATTVSALATSLTVMLVGRVVQGAAGGIFPLAFGIIRDEFPRERVAGAVGIMSALLGVGGGAGVVLAGPIVQRLSIHWLFWFPLVLLVPATIAVYLFVPESPVRVPGRVNWPGAALMSGGLAAVLLAVSEAPVWGWLSARTLVVFAIGVSLLVAWVRNETRSDHPLVDMRMMRIRGVWTTNAVAALLGFGMYASFILLPEYVETPARRGLRFRRLCQRGGAVPRSLDDRDADRGRADRAAREAVRVKAAAARRRGVDERVVRLARAGQHRAVGDLPGGAAARRRHRLRLRLDGRTSSSRTSARPRLASPPA